MAKIFVSYKYKDNDVQPLDEIIPGEDTNFLHSPRHYVDHIIDLVGIDHIYKGEKSDDDAGHLADSTISSNLKDKLFDSSATIILLSPNMWDKTRPQKEQWIPNEVYYSLLNKNRGEKNSTTNGLLAVALPDYNGLYDYIVTQNSCGVRSWNTPNLFYVIKKNMFNLDSPTTSGCDSCSGVHYHGGDHSYIHPVKWVDFIADHNKYIDHMFSLRERINEYTLVKSRGDD